MASEIVTLIGDENVLDGGENVGAATWFCSVYVALVVWLCRNPAALAIAVIVSDVFTVIAPVYWVDDVVGVEPSVV